MRISLLAGVLMIFIGCGALYTLRNGFFMFALGHLSYFPPSEPAEIEAEFKELARVPSFSPSVVIGDVAKARVNCIRKATGERISPTAEEAFRRFNLMLLGAGYNSSSPVIDPEARRITEIRRDLVQEGREWYDVDLNERESTRLRDVFDELTQADHIAYAGLDLKNGFADFDLRSYANALARSGESVHACVNEVKYHRNAS